MKMLIKDFIEEVKSEIACYESCGDEKAKQWEEGFLNIIKNPKTSKKNIKDNKYYMLKDEGEIFAIADAYCDAVENSKEEQYWQQWD